MCEVASFKNFGNSLTTVEVMTKTKVAPFYLGPGVVCWLTLFLVGYDQIGIPTSGRIPRDAKFLKGNWIEVT